MRLIAAILLLLLPSTSFAASADAVIFSRKGEVALSMELATSEAERTKGLMGRTELEPYDGMLFLFPKPSDYAFWMKDTPHALDILFIDATHTIVHISPDTKPFTTKPQAAGVPIIAVMELDAGRAAREGVAVGDKVRYVLPENTAVH